MPLTSKTTAWTGTADKREGGKKMELPELEIVRDYRLAKRPKKIIPILAQTLGCSRAEVENVLKKHGMIVDKLEKKKRPWVWKTQEAQRKIDHV